MRLSLRFIARCAAAAALVSAPVLSFAQGEAEESVSLPAFGATWEGSQPSQARAGDRWSVEIAFTQAVPLERLADVRLVFQLKDSRTVEIPASRVDFSTSRGFGSFQVDSLAASAVIPTDAAHGVGVKVYLYEFESGGPTVDLGLQAPDGEGLVVVPYW